MKIQPEKTKPTTSPQKHYIKPQLKNQKKNKKKNKSTKKSIKQENTITYNISRKLMISSTVEDDITPGVESKIRLVA